ncbi:LacI family DNA-binding transcriptional regulator [Salinimonas marina]|uniref:LacI family DNA-binding transcriptional regulator n=1 Tax=Salinimonas marina TaxID=2785918 RepID=A0A7S9HCZ2_9ALTE|nr:LacI family DNA-binding transcriptional regulator [Salinimonas marina]QPG05766.1 LacI family DNA-binding transcriptional regulator [Salinimonas marina]
MTKIQHSTLAMQDIAERAGVSKATVSRVINNPDRVSEKTRARVIAVVSELGYSPNHLAAGLRQGRSKNIAVLLPDITNPYFAPVVQSIEQVAMSQGYSVILNDTQDDPELEKKFASMIFTRQIDGIITNSARLPFPVPLGTSAPALPPMVNASEFCDTPDVIKVGVDNYQIGRDATEFLLHQGHTAIAVLAGPENQHSSVERLRGFVDVLQENNLPFPSHWVFHSDYSMAGGDQGARSLMQWRERPTAIFSFGDLASFGVMHALRELGYNIPEDVSVMSVDGIAMGEYLAPPLTTIAQPLTEIGRTSAQLLIDIIEGRPPQKTTYMLAHHTIVRKSVRAYRR